MALHVFVIEVAEDQEPLNEAAIEGLEAAFQTTEAVTDAEYRGTAEQFGFHRSDRG
jgi:hypothetical protein